MYIKAFVNLYQEQCADLKNLAMTLATVPNSRSYLNKALDSYAARINANKKPKDFGSISLVETNSANGECHDGPDVAVDGDDNADVSKRRHLILPAHLSKILIQDAIAIIATGETD
ncbi:hypothetical protein EDD21DRAFT_410848 [Dissophora ornata]|nr:hypothetical protein BGZ58_000539 [Dissophora ornata]KAI8605720.1 hypothetical protein EDD21DRAFT_410848 [Dissophora ornata]